MRNLLKGAILVGFGVVVGLMISDSKEKDDKNEVEENIADELDEETNDAIKQIKKELRKKIYVNCAIRLALLSGIQLLLMYQYLEDVREKRILHCSIIC